jgi:hypothetical protein
VSHLNINKNLILFTLLAFLWGDIFSQNDSCTVNDQYIFKLRFKRTNDVSDAELTLSESKFDSFQLKIVCTIFAKKIPHILVFREDSLLFTFNNLHTLILNFPASDTIIHNRDGDLFWKRTYEINQSQFSNFTNSRLNEIKTGRIILKLNKSTSVDIQKKSMKLLKLRLK